MNEPTVKEADAQPDGERRRYLQGLFATGFALAVSPLARAAVNTPNKGLLTGPVEIPVADGRLPAFRAQPATATGPLPVILVVQEIFGVHEYIQDVCRRLAHEGYLAIAPELFFRQGDPRQYQAIADIIQNVVSRVPDAQVMRDLDACLQWAAEHGGDNRRQAITGFCWGGRISWLYAAHNPGLKAAIAWYGRLEGNLTDNNPHYPLNIVTRLQAPVLGLYGGQDKGIPLESVERMQKALQAAGKTESQIVVYPDAGHAFHADYRPSWHAEAARDGWQRLLRWLSDKGMKSGT